MMNRKQKRQKVRFLKTLHKEHQKSLSLNNRVKKRRHKKGYKN